ncbi:MAG: Antiholin-like protein LrgA [Enterocloster aldenensis]
MKYLFQFGTILAFCFLGELLHTLLPLPIPASIYGLALLLLALKMGFVKLSQVRETALFLTKIFPILFVPAAVGVMELYDSLMKMLIPVLLALLPVTVLVMIVSGRVTQRICGRGERET